MSLTRRSLSVGQKMKTIILLLSLTFATNCFGAPAATPAAYAELFYRAAQAKDTEQLALLFHPQSLSGHRKFVEIALMKLEKTYGEQAVWAVVGKSKNEMNALGDLDYFRQTMRTALELSAIDARPSVVLPKVVGELSDGAVVYVLSTQEYSIEESGKKFSMRSPQSLSFKKYMEEWRVFSFPYAAHVARLYASELAAASKVTE